MGTLKEMILLTSGVILLIQHGDSSPAPVIPVPVPPVLISPTPVSPTPPIHRTKIRYTEKILSSSWLQSFLHAPIAIVCKPEEESCGDTCYLTTESVCLDGMVCNVGYKLLDSKCCDPTTEACNYANSGLRFRIWIWITIGVIAFAILICNCCIYLCNY